MSGVRRLLRKIGAGVRIAVRQPIPMGIFSVNYLYNQTDNGEQSAALQVHRKLLSYPFLPAPRIINWLFSLWLWFRWTVFSAWRTAFIVVKKHGPTVHSHHGISYRKQFCEVMVLALLHTIPPFAYYRYRFYEPGRQPLIWTYVFNTEVFAYHRWRNGKSTKAMQTQQALLADKYAFCEKAETQGISVTRTQLINAGSNYHQLPKSFSQTMFCKPRKGARSQGAFRITWDANTEPEIDLVSGLTIKANKAIGYIDEQLRGSDYLLQPSYQNHPLLQRLLKSTDEPISLRVITQKDTNGFAAYCAYVEVPLNSGFNNQYSIIPVDLDTGGLHPERMHRVASEFDEQLQALDDLAKSVVIPHWQTCIDQSIKAHTLVNAIYAVAWDFIITEDCPVLLEGNSNWRIDIPQQICGPLLELKRS